MIGEEKKKRGVKHPHVIVQTLVNKLNQDKLDDIKKFVKPYADGFILKKMHLGRSKEQKESNLYFETDLGEFRREKLGKQGRYYKDMPYCHHISSLVVLSNGQVTQCCFDFDGEVSFGNLLHDDYNKVIKSEHRKEFIKTFFNRTNKLCHKCDFLAGMVQDVYLDK
jgi:radical SAM protein with 4Fe4S-binding SPASM domain